VVHGAAVAAAFKVDSFFSVLTEGVVVDVESLDVGKGDCFLGAPGGSAVAESIVHIVDGVVIKFDISNVFRWLTCAISIDT